MEANNDMYLAKREASERYLAPLPDVPQFAALTTAWMAAAARPLLNVHAVGLGLKEVAGAPDAVLAVRFYVLCKMPLAMLSPSYVLPTSIAGVPTDVIEGEPANFAAALCTAWAPPGQRARLSCGWIPRVAACQSRCCGTLNRSLNHSGCAW